MYCVLMIALDRLRLAHECQCEMSWIFDIHRVPYSYSNADKYFVLKSPVIMDIFWGTRITTPEFCNKLALSALRSFTCDRLLNGIKGWNKERRERVRQRIALYANDIRGKDAVFLLFLEMWKFTLHSMKRNYLRSLNHQPHWGPSFKMIWCCFYCCSLYKAI